MVSSLRSNLLRIGSCAVIAVNAASGAGAFTTDCDTVDLTRVVVAPRPGHSISMGTVGSGDDLASAPQFPLAVELLEVQLQAETLDAGFTYTMRWTNDTQAPVWIPISGKPIYREKGEYPEGYRHVVFEFAVHDTGWGDSVIDVYVLYGASSVPGSLRRVDPGQCVTLRVPGILRAYPAAREIELHSTPAPTLTAGVSVYLFDPRDATFSRFTRPREAKGIAFTLGPPQGRGRDAQNH